MTKEIKHIRNKFKNNVLTYTFIIIGTVLVLGVVLSTLLDLGAFSQLEPFKEQIHHTVQALVYSCIGLVCLGIGIERMADLGKLEDTLEHQNTTLDKQNILIEGGDNSTIISNQFQTTRTGIIARECINNAYINYVSNQMSNVTTGIYLLQNAGAIMSISDNNIVTAQDPRAGGIKVVESTTFSSNGAFVSKNNIETYGNYGVWFQNNAKGGIHDNSIKLKQFSSPLNPNRYCIRVENSLGETINCNGLEGENTSLINVPSYGLSITYTPQNLIDCNSTSRTRIAMGFIGDCDKSTIQGNTYNFHKFGLYVGADATSQQGVIGDQTLNQNNETRGNRFQGLNNSGNYPTGYAIYRYHPSFSPYSQLFWTGPNVGIDFYTQLSSGANFAGNEINSTFHTEPPYRCPSYCQNMVQPIVENDGEIEDKENLVEGSGGFADLDEVLRFSLEKELYEKLKGDPSLLDSSVVLEMFFYINSQANLGKLTQVEEKLHSLMDTIVNNDSTLKAQRILQAKVENESISTNSLIEQNMKIINSVKLETIVKGIFSFTESQQEQITQVAFQCPYIGGKSVYDARGLYALIDEEHFFDDDVICNSTGNLRRADSEIERNDLVKVHPIPVHSMSTFEYILNESKEYSFSITDALGKIIYLNIIDGTLHSKEIDMSQWQDGVYYYHITDNRSEFYNGKVILVK